MEIHTNALTGDWLACYSGKKFYPASPRPDQFDAKDIARSLAHICRFAGHIRFFYSVAQHSVLCYQVAPDHLKAWALMHDASEGHLVDIPRPIKICLPEYKLLEAKAQRALAERFGLDPTMPAEIHDIDNRMLVTEAAVLCAPSLPWWKELHWPPAYNDVPIERWSIGRARKEFTKAFNEQVALGNLKP